MQHKDYTSNEQSGPNWASIRGRSARFLWGLSDRWYALRVMWRLYRRWWRFYNMVGWQDAGDVLIGLSIRLAKAELQGSTCVDFISEEV